MECFSRTNADVATEGRSVIIAFSADTVALRIDRRSNGEHLCVIVYDMIKVTFILKTGVRKPKCFQNYPTIIDSKGLGSITH